MITGCAAIVLTCALWVVYRHENAKRDAIVYNNEHVENSEFMDLTDRQNKEFRYVL